jgi:hypothetical protein
MILTMLLAAVGGAFAAAPGLPAERRGKAGSVATREPTPTVWILDRLDEVGGHPMEILGAPRTAEGSLVFDGKEDGIVLPTNPLAHLKAFTVQVLFCPAANGPRAQRFFHVEDTEGWRALVELRMDESHWWLDTFLGSRVVGAGRMLIDPQRKHAPDRYYWAALRYDGETMTAFVDGVREAQGKVRWGPMGEGRTSLGVRLNRVSWYRGAIRRVEVSPVALPVEQLHRMPVEAGEGRRTPSDQKPPRE